MKNFLNKIKEYKFRLEVTIWFWYMEKTEELRVKAEKFIYKMNDKL